MNIKLPYIEPVIRTLAGAVFAVCGVVVLVSEAYRDIALWVLFIASLNLVQSGFSGFCVMERFLRRLGFGSEIDTIRRLNQAMAVREAEAKHHLETLDMLNEVVIEISREQILTQASQPLRGLVGNMGAHPLLGLPVERIVAEEDRPDLRELLARVMAGKEDIARSRFRLHPETGHEIWVEGKFARVREGGVATAIRGILRDVTEPHMQEQRIAKMALHDALTGLPNRVLLEDRMLQAALLAGREKRRYAILFIDLDNFKQVNDVHGHKMGDLLLLEVSKTLSARLRQSDTLARWGGDEFVALLPNIEDAADVLGIAGKLADELRAHLAREHSNYNVTLSIGGAIYPDDADSAESLLIQADKALFHAKALGRDNIQMFGAMEHAGEIGKDVDFSARFAEAVQLGRIQVHYQPVVDARTRLTVGMEALARWHDTRYGWVSPATFIPLAENLGLVEPLGRLVMEQALAHFARCGTCLADDMFVSLNVSNRQLFSDDFRADLIAMADRHGIAPERIRLEIAESVTLLGMDRARDHLGKLSNAGFRIALDDFGGGHASLANLHAIPVDELKFDMSFVRRVQTHSGRVVLKSLIEMGRALGMNMVAKGVETRDCADQLEAMGIHHMQGYYFGLPLAEDECMRDAESGATTAVLHEPIFMMKPWHWGAFGAKRG